MNREDIIRMVREECPYTSEELRGAFYDGFMKAAALVAAAEREACAKVAEDEDFRVDGRGYYDQLGDARATANNIANAIRARGKQ